MAKRDENEREKEKKKKEKKTYFLSTITNIYHSKHFFFFFSSVLASSICSVSNYCHMKKNNNLRFVSFFASKICTLVHSFTQCVWVVVAQHIADQILIPHTLVNIYTYSQSHNLATTHSFNDLQLLCVCSRVFLLIFYFYTF